MDVDRVVGVHVNYLPTPPQGDLSGLSEENSRRLAHIEQHLSNRAGYWVQQATLRKPSPTDCPTPPSASSR